MENEFWDIIAVLAHTLFLPLLQYSALLQLHHGIRATGKWHILQNKASHTYLNLLSYPFPVISAKITCQRSLHTATNNKSTEPNPLPTQFSNGQYQTYCKHPTYPRPPHMEMPTTKKSSMQVSLQVPQRIAPMPRQTSHSWHDSIPLIRYATWMLIDQYLMAALYSIICPPLIPYVLHNLGYMLWYPEYSWKTDSIHQ